MLNAGAAGQSSCSPLRVCSYYSAGWGTASVERLVQRAQELGLRTLALTDVGTLAGQMRFHAACKEAGIRPITGVQLGDVTLLARSREGYQSLCEAVSLGEICPRPGLLALSPRPLAGWDPDSVFPPTGPVAVMARADEHPLHLLKVAIRHQLTVRQAEKLAAPAQAVLRPQPGAERIAELCELDLTTNPRILPEGDPASLRARCQGQESARLEQELKLIESRGLAGYFLRVAEIAAEATSRGIPFCLRGSAVGSLVAYRLGLTPFDPEQHGLYFERFLHGHRADLPDIDLDFASERRDELLGWLFRRYSGQVAMVGVHQTFQARAAFRAGLKALGMPRAEVEHFCRRLPEPELEAPPPLHLLTPRFRAQAALLLQLVGSPSHLSTHPGGVFFTPAPIQRFAPVLRAGRGLLTCQYDMAACEQAGLVKIDLLGNRFLSELAEVAPGPIPADDPATLHTLAQADTLGCFQVETPAVRDVLRRLPIRRFADVVTALALVRPGAAAGLAKSAFFRRARGLEPARPADPRLEESLLNTYGLPLFEEDIMTMLAVLGDMSLAQADAWRESILRGGELPPGLPPLAAEQIRRFAAYSFNRAHATSYAWLAYQAAFLKTHEPVRFAAAMLNHHGGAYPLRTLVADMQRHGVRFLPPHVNYSQEQSVVERDAVRVGLGHVRYLTAANRALLLSRRPFQSMDQLPELSFREQRALVLAGACDGLPPLDPQLYPYAHQAWLEGHPGPIRLQIQDSPERVELFQKLARASNEVHYLHMHLSEHPLALLRPSAERSGCLPIARLAREGPARVLALVCASRRVATRSGGADPLQFVTFEDETGLCEAVVTPDVYARLGNPLSSPGPFLVEGRMQASGRLAVRQVLPFHQRSRDS